MKSFDWPAVTHILKKNISVMSFLNTLHPALLPTFSYTVILFSICKKRQLIELNVDYSNHCSEQIEMQT